MKRSEAVRLRRYADAIAMWVRGFDTAAIARELKLPEPVIDRWVWNFREMARAA